MVTTTMRTGRSLPIELGPSSTYEAVTREKVEGLAENVNEIRSRVNSIFYLLIGSLLMDVLLGLWK